ncbi:transposase [Desulfobacterota bacterium AH_259_B03_O07]|nr:transposase [Desulfobacterota bacterium AH_259_B03_O07]
MKERRSVSAVVAKRYQKATKKEKGTILGEYTQLTGYNRCYAAFLLRNHGRRMRINNNTVLVGDCRKRVKRTRDRTYDERVVRVLKRVWLIMGFICGKRLKPALKEVIPVLEKYKEIEVDKTVREKLSNISAATIDRVLASERKKRSLRHRARTKPGTLLKHQIPIRTFSEWDEQRPGFVEIDLVGHEGGDPSGDYIQTLDMTDVCTGWTETQAVKNKARVWVFEALKDIRKRLPFKLLGIDSDNGSEFINDHLYGYCEEEKITFTRARAYRKNDNCYVEQKNYSVVRRGVGYHRYDTPQQLRLLNRLYSRLRLYTNYFQPVMKLEEKIRVGSKVKKRYDQPRTPYQRVLEAPLVEKEKKKKLDQEYAKLNPAELRRQITTLQIKLRKLAAKENLKKRNHKQNYKNDKNQKDLEYISREATN